MDNIIPYISGIWTLLWIAVRFFALKAGDFSLKEIKKTISQDMCSLDKKTVKGE